MMRPLLNTLILCLTALSFSCADDEEPLGPPDCELEPYVEHEVTEDRNDIEGPGEGAIDDVIISRGRPPGILGLTSCDNTGVLSVVLQTPSDDNTLSVNLGVRLRTATEGLPEGLILPENLIRAPSGVVDIVWNDREGQDAFAFDLQVSFVDQAGNFGEFSEPYRVEDRGSFF